jgi:hypothetical protein
MTALNLDSLDLDPVQLFSDYLRVTRVAHLGPEPAGAPDLLGKRLGLLNGASWVTLWSNYFGRLYLLCVSFLAPRPGHRLWGAGLYQRPVRFRARSRTAERRESPDVGLDQADGTIGFRAVRPQPFSSTILLNAPTGLHWRSYDRQTNVSHAYVHLVEFGTPVRVGGLVVEPDPDSGTILG